MWEHVTTHIQAAEKFLDTPEIPWKSLITSLLWIVYLFETYVSWRQYRLYSLTTPPKALMAHVSHEDFVKSQRYGRDKARFAFVSDAVAHMVNLASVTYNLSAHVWVWSGYVLDWMKVAHSEKALSGANLVLGLMLQMPVGFILGAYRNFVIEERHGFNKQTWSMYCMDHVKQCLLSVILGVPIMALIVSVIRWAGDAFVVYTVLLFTALILFGTIIYPTLIQPLFNKLTPLKEGMLRDRVTALASSLKFPLKHLYVIDGSKRSSHSNAYFYGVIPGGSKHIVIFDTLIEQSTTAEIEAVLAHELGHWVYAHPSKLLIISLSHIAVTLSLFTLFINNASLFRAFGFGQDRQAIAYVTYLPVAVGFELFNLVLHPIDALVQFGMHAVTRQMEYSADRYVFLALCGTPVNANRVSLSLFLSPTSDLLRCYTAPARLRQNWRHSPSCMHKARVSCPRRSRMRPSWIGSAICRMCPHTACRRPCLVMLYQKTTNRTPTF